MSRRFHFISSDSSSTHQSISSSASSPGISVVVHISMPVSISLPLHPPHLHLHAEQASSPDLSLHRPTRQVDRACRATTTPTTRRDPSHYYRTLRRLITYTGPDDANCRLCLCSTRLTGALRDFRPRRLTLSPPSFPSRSPSASSLSGNSRRRSRHSLVSAPSPRVRASDSRV